jgi:hypothetical protein
MYKYLAERWLREKHAELQLTHEKSHTRWPGGLLEAEKRVRAILDGEVRRSEMTPADLLIWHGRWRTLYKGPPASFVMAEDRPAWQRMSDGRRVEVTEVVPFAVYDSFGTDDWPIYEHQRLFGNANIGQTLKCNLMMGSRLACDDYPYLATAWWVSCPWDDQLATFWDKMASEMMVGVCAGDKLYRQASLLDLWRGPQPVEVTVLPRQNFYVDVHSTHAAVNTWNEFAMKYNQDHPFPTPPIRVRVHIEGWQRRDRL